MLDQPVGTFAPDSTKNNNTGTIIGGVTLGEVGPSNTLPKAMGFDGSTGYINTPSELFTDDLILESWVWVSGTNPYTADANKGIVGQRIGGNGNMIEASYNGTGWVILYQVMPNSMTDYALTNGILPLETWTHVVLTQSSRFGTIVYANAVEQATKPTWVGNLNLGSAPILIGYDTCNVPWRHFPGFLSAVAIYPLALTPGQIMRHYMLGKTQFERVTSTGDYMVAAS